MLDLQEISDRLEIEMMIDRYAAAIDRLELDVLDNIFTPDVIFDFSMWPGGEAVRTLSDLRAWCTQFLGKVPGQHINANKEISLDGDRASGRILCLNPHVLPEEAAQGRPGLGFHALWYLDDYVRTADGWRIARRSEERSLSAFTVASIMYPSLKD